MLEDAAAAAVQVRASVTEFAAAARRVATIVIRELFLESTSSAIPRSCDTPVLTFAVGGLVIFLAHDSTGMFCGTEGIAKHEVRVIVVFCFMYL